MKTWNRFFQSCSLLKISFAAVFFSMIGFGAFTHRANAQGRVNAYTTQTSFSGAGVWNDLSLSGSASYIGDQIFYYDQDENGNYVNTTLPFNFKYDNTTISVGSTIYLGPSSLSFQGTPPEGVSYAGLGQSAYPGDIFFWGGEYITAG